MAQESIFVSLPPAEPFLKMATLLSKILGNCLKIKKDEETSKFGRLRYSKILARTSALGDLASDVFFEVLKSVGFSIPSQSSSSSSQDNQEEDASSIYMVLKAKVSSELVNSHLGNVTSFIERGAKVRQSAATKTKTTFTPKTPVMKSSATDANVPTLHRHASSRPPGGLGIRRPLGTGGTSRALSSLSSQTTMKFLTLNVWFDQLELERRSREIGALLLKEDPGKRFFCLCCFCVSISVFLQMCSLSKKLLRRFCVSYPDYLFGGGITSVLPRLEIRTLLCWGSYNDGQTARYVAAPCLHFPASSGVRSSRQP